MGVAGPGGVIKAGSVEVPVKVGAHPLLVAAAFGLLGPAALFDEPEDRREPCAGCDCGLRAPCTVEETLEGGLSASLEVAPSEDEFPMVIVPGLLELI
jgi:hypothetical protein